MIAGAPLAPDGLDALAALAARHGWPGDDLLSPALAAALGARPTTEDPGRRLARVVARRTVAGERDRSADPTPAARLARRWGRRWRIAQTDEAALPPRARLEAAGLRAHRAGLATGLAPEAAGLWVWAWASDDPGRRRDRVALAPPALARAVGHTPPLPFERAVILWT